MMFLKRLHASFAALIVALALGAPAVSASATNSPVWENPGQGSPHCPDWYSGPTNLATGCPWWIMIN
jgi:hypothetical protein